MESSVSDIHEASLALTELSAAISEPIELLLLFTELTPLLTELTLLSTPFITALAALTPEVTDTVPEFEPAPLVETWALLPLAPTVKEVMIGELTAETSPALEDRLGAVLIAACNPAVPLAASLADGATN